MDVAFFKENWEWISLNWWGAVGLLLTGLTIGITLAKLYYDFPGRAQSTATAAAPEPEPSAFSYPQFGRHGKNVLANSTGDVTVRESVSLRADIPSGSRLTLEMFGPPSIYLDDTAGSWHMTLGQSLNWTWETYNPDGGGKQRFVAEGGVADLQLSFAREGDVRVVVYEGESKSPSWSKTLVIHASRSGT